MLIGRPIPSLQSLCFDAFFKQDTHFNPVNSDFQSAFARINKGSTEHAIALNLLKKLPLEKMATLPLLNDAVDEYNEAIKEAISRCFQIENRREGALLFVYILDALKNEDFSAAIREDYARIVRSLNNEGAFVGLEFSFGQNLSGLDLSRLNLSQSVMCGVDFSGADLTDTNLTDTQLSYAELDKANLTDTLLEGAKYNIWTKWPWFVSLNARDYDLTIWEDDPRSNELLMHSARDVAIVIGAVTAFALYGHHTLKQMKEWDADRVVTGIDNAATLGGLLLSVGGGFTSLILA